MGLTLVPVSHTSTTVVITADARSQVMAAYPWSFTSPAAEQVENDDVGSFNGGVVQFRQLGKPWFAEVGATVAPSSGSTGAGDFGPTPANQQLAYGSDGTGGKLAWRLSVPSRGRTVWLAVAGSHTGRTPALGALKGALADPGALLAEKVRSYDAFAAQSALSVPDASIKLALLWSKLDLAEMRRTVTDLQLRDVQAGSTYPTPIATVRSLSGVDAAYPDYAEFFGTDGAYSTYGLAVAGQWQSAIDQLDAMRTVSELVNGKTGKVVHEINSTGAVYYGDNGEPGDLNETAQFAIAAGLLWRWSGDPSVLSDNYQFIDEGLHYLVRDRGWRSLATRRRHRRGLEPRCRGARRRLRDGRRVGRPSADGSCRTRRCHGSVGGL